MGVLAWWILPVAIALAVGAVVSMWGKRPHIRGSFEEVEAFHRFLNTLKHQSVERAPRDGRPTA
jgi:hypothetical protein